MWRRIHKKVKGHLYHGITCDNLIVDCGQWGKSNRNSAFWIYIYTPPL